MKLAQDRLSLLVLHGLAENEAKAYLTLLDHPGLAVAALAKLTQIPRNRLYEILDSLHGKHLVEIRLEEGGRTYRAQPFVRYLDERVEDLERRVAEMRQRREYLSAAFTPANESESLEDAHGASMRLVVGRRAVSRLVDEMLDRAEDSVVAVGTRGGSERVVRHVAPFRARAEASAPTPTFEVVLPREAVATAGIERLEGLDVRVRWLSEPVPCLGFVADDRELVQAFPLPDDGSLRAGRDVALHTTNAGFARNYSALARAASVEDA